MATATLLTQGASGWEASATDGFTSASISPGANCALVLLIGCVADDNGAARDLLTGSSVTSSGTGPTWTERATGGQPAASFEANGGVYTAVIGGTDPGAFTVTWAANFNTQVGARAYAIYKITGHDTTTTFGGKVATAPETGNGAESATLDAAPASADITLAMGYADEDDVGGGFGATFDTGWTEDYDGTSVTNFKGAFNVGQRTSSTSTTVSWTDINTGSHTYSSALMAIVVKAAAGGTNAAAGNAAGTGAAYGATTSIKPSGGHASATGSAPDAQASIKPSAGHASATGAAYDATTTSSGNATPSAATATGSGYDASTKVSPSGGHASATGAAYDATVSVGTFTNASAGNASATGAAYTAQTSVAPSGGHASATGAAADASGSVAPAAGHASATGAAVDASVWVSVSAAIATATGAAQAPTAAVYASGGHASATGAAYNPSVSVGAVVADPTPLTLTVRDSGHTTTILDEGHTLTDRGSGHTTTAKVSPRHHTTTSRGRGHTSTARENR